MFLLISIIPIAIIDVISNKSAGKALKNSDFNQLQSVGNHMSERIILFLGRKYRDIAVLAKAQNTVEAFNKLKEYHDNGGATPLGPFNVNSERYKKIYSEIDPFFREYLDAYDFTDIYFICAAHGHIMYTVSEGVDLGINLSTGKYKDIGLAKLWKNVVQTQEPTMIDFNYHEPTGETASFIGTPVFDNDGKLISVLALQISTQRINNIMTNYTGLGETGETYLVGDDYLMRSDSRFSEESTILKTKVDTESTRLGLKHQTGIHVTKDYRDVSVLSFYDHIGLNESFGLDFEWLMVAEIDEAEVVLAATQLRNQILIIGFLMALLVAFFAVWFARYFTKPIVQLKKVSGFLANGDLTQKIEINRDDEIGVLADSFKAMQKNLRKQFSEIKEGVNTLASSSSEILATTSQIAAGTAEAASSISETSATVEEVCQAAQLSTDKAKNISEGAKQTVQVTTTGQKAVEKTISGMNDIREQMATIANTIVNLSEQSQLIGSIIASVNDVADQSNLLAVNAAIEASRAGEQGKGFSVVAQEIKTMAEQSKKATAQVRGILNEIQKATSAAVMATEQGSKAVEIGVKQSLEAGESIRLLSENTNEAMHATTQIAASSQQQLVGMEQIGLAMESIKQAGMENASGMKQSKDTAQDLNELGLKLKQIVELYKL
ncbi:MAG: methyl-accepting chemotaxis protein [Prolixibacteraceae bacterium]|nr:methyl-accepting chemotaxis protein [Prolixibacteraceae bacterium]MBT6763893.1 methyl-accepting chemotaxis protein [Prolixibacteraceae bacterium]MBT6999606.1 methyl-accepting chemotaxis protein [Prolixibacteraceae bacterium]MBT7393826.1 methyl-accepting chemotaxis protein [Prolixibacteraceae bacterium]